MLKKTKTSKKISLLAVLLIFSLLLSSSLVYADAGGNSGANGSLTGVIFSAAGETEESSLTVEKIVQGEEPEGVESYKISLFDQGGSEIDSCYLTDEEEKQFEVADGSYMLEETAVFDGFSDQPLPDNLNVTYSGDIDSDNKVTRQSGTEALSCTIINTGDNANMTVEEYVYDNGCPEWKLWYYDSGSAADGSIVYTSTLTESQLENLWTENGETIIRVDAGDLAGQGHSLEPGRYAFQIYQPEGHDVEVDCWTGDIEVTSVGSSYSVTVTNTFEDNNSLPVLSSEKEITAYSVEGVTATINANAHSVYVRVPDGTDLTNLIATFTLSDGASATVGAVEQVSGVSCNDFTDPIKYTVKAADGSTKEWWVNVRNHSGSTVISIETEYGGDIFNAAGDLVNADGSLAWGGSLGWILNPTYGHMYFKHYYSDLRLCEHLVTTIEGTSPGQVVDQDGITATRSSYTYRAPDSSGGTFEYEAVQYELVQPDGFLDIPGPFRVILRSRGSGHGINEAYFDIYIEDPEGSVTALRADPLWFTYTEMSMEEALTQTSGTDNKVGDMPTENADYYLDITGGSDMGGTTFQFHTRTINCANTLTPNLDSSFPVSFSYEYSGPAASYTVFDILFLPTLLSETHSPTAPAIDPDGGSFSSAQSVVLNNIETGCTAYYTTDGSNPTSSSTAMEYNNAFLLSGNATVKAAVYDPESELWSDVISADFAIVTKGSSNSGGSDDTVPTVKTGEAEILADASAVLPGRITSRGGETITAYGFTYSSEEQDWIEVEAGSDNLLGDFEYTLTGLAANTIYYFKAYAVNSAGTAYGDEESFIIIQEQSPLAPADKTVMRFYIGQNDYYINDQIQTMDTVPIIMEDRTLLPIRYVAEALGAEVSWDAAERKVTISLNDKTIELWIGQGSAAVNGISIPIDPDNPLVTPIIQDPGRSMLPLRFVAEALDCQVDWDAAAQEVKVTYP